MTLGQVLRWVSGRSAPLLALGLLVLVVGSWAPFQLDPPLPRTNAAELRADGTLRVEPSSLVRTAGPPTWLDDVIEAGAFTLRLDARTDVPRQDGPARLVSVSWDAGERNLTVGQLSSALVLRLRHPGTDDQGQPQLVVPGVFTDPGWRRIEVDVGEQLEVSVDGEAIWRFGLDDDPLAGWEPGYPLLFGDERTGLRGWDGELRDVTLEVDGRVHDLFTTDELLIPDRYWHVPDRLTEPSTSRPAWTNVAAGLLHVATGLVIGGLLALRRPQRSVARTALLWAAVSIVVNLGKVVIATRHPSAATALLQIGGGGIGITLVLATAARRPALLDSGGAGRTMQPATSGGRRR